LGFQFSHTSTNKHKTKIIMPEPKTYAPMSAKKNSRVQFFCINASFRADKMIEFINQHKNEKGYVNLQIKERREPDQYGNDLSVTLDTFVPQKQEGGQPRQQSARPAQPRKPETDDDGSDPVPF
jgi:hypothetical protein